MVPAINAYLDVLVEDVLPNFGVDSGQRIVKEVDVGIGIQRPGEVHLAATDEGKSTNRKILYFIFYTFYMRGGSKFEKFTLSVD